MRVFMEVIRTMPNRFYTNVLKSYLLILRQLRDKQDVDENEENLKEHAEVIEFIKDRHYKLLQEGSNLATRVEACNIEQHRNLYGLKRQYFHKFKLEKDLHKYCLKSKEIKLILGIVFSVFNYCEEAKNGSVTFQGYRKEVVKSMNPASPTKKAVKAHQKYNSDSKSFAKAIPHKQSASLYTGVSDDGEIPFTSNSNLKPELNKDLYLAHEPNS